VLGGSRGAAAERAGLTYHVDDSAQNCVDIVSDSRAKPILIVPDNDATTIASARRLGIGTGAVAQRLPRRARAGHVRPNTAGSTRKNLRPRRVEREVTTHPIATDARALLPHGQRETS